MFVFEPDGGDEGNEVIWVYWRSVRGQDVTSPLKEFRKRYLDDRRTAHPRRAGCEEQSEGDAVNRRELE
jgi:hypothetical protein